MTNDKAQHPNDKSREQGTVIRDWRLEIRDSWRLLEIHWGLGFRQNETEAGGGLGLLQTVLDCDDCCLGAVRDAKFGQNSADMIPHCPIG